MPSLVAIRFTLNGRVHYFDPAELDLSVDDRVSVETDEGPVSKISIFDGPFVAIDGMVVWQSLTLLPNDTILATVFNQPSHGRCEGDMDCFASTDGGRSWQFRSRVCEHEPGTNRQA